MRFHKYSLDDLADSGKEFYQVFRDIATARQGIYRCNLIDLASKLGVKPYNIPKMLYGLQHGGKDDIAYDLDRESFVLEFSKIPHQTHVYELSEAMLTETRRIAKEKNADHKHGLKRIAKQISKQAANPLDPDWIGVAGFVPFPFLSILSCCTLHFSFIIYSFACFISHVSFVICH